MNSCIRTPASLISQEGPCCLPGGGRIQLQNKQKEGKEVIIFFVDVSKHLFNKKRSVTEEAAVDLQVFSATACLVKTQVIDSNFLFLKKKCPQPSHSIRMLSVNGFIISAIHHHPFNYQHIFFSLHRYVLLAWGLSLQTVKMCLDSMEC